MTGKGIAMKELPIHMELRPESGETLYEQIYGFIRNEIRMEYGEKTENHGK